MPKFQPRLASNDPPAARIAEALRALRADGDGGSFVILHAGKDYAQVAGSNFETELHWEAARDAWYEGQPVSSQDDAGLRALGLMPPRADSVTRNYQASVAATPGAIDQLAGKLWAALSQVFGHRAADLRIEAQLEDPLDKFG